MPVVLATQQGADTHREDPLTHLNLTIDGQRTSYETLRGSGAHTGPGRSGRIGQPRCSWDQPRLPLVDGAGTGAPGGRLQPAQRVFHCSCTTGPPLSPLPTAAAFGASLPFHHVVRPVWGAATVPLLTPLRCRRGSQVTSCPRAGHQCSSRGWWTSSSMVARERCVIRTTAQNPDDSGEIWASSYLYRRGITLRTGPGGTMRRHDTKGCAACDE